MGEDGIEMSRDEGFFEEGDEEWFGWRREIRLRSSGFFR